MLDPETRRKRKEEGREKKRQRIQESGGVRPRDDDRSGKKGPKKSSEGSTKSDVTKKESPAGAAAAKAPSSFGNQPTTNSGYKRVPSSFNKRPMTASSSGHRFGRVMQKVPCRNKSRFSTLSIALPGSVLSNCQTKELRTLLVGQIARAATIYHVDEIIVFDDKLSAAKPFGGGGGGGWRQRNDRDRRRNNSEDAPKKEGVEEKSEEQPPERQHTERLPRSNPQEFMARVLQYCECPQYLRRKFFPMHPDLQFTGLLAPVDAPHHVRADDHSPFREGVVIEKTSSDGGSLVNCGIRNRPVAIDRKLAPGIRCTVQIDPAAYGKVTSIKGTVVSPSVPREQDGTYWGYTTRIASSINDVFDSCPFAGGYDLKIGTSERGDTSTEDKKFSIPKYEHALLVFGGVAGIEECVDADEAIKLPGAQSRKLFDVWLNTCPFQGSRTIRTEEAVLISLAAVSPALAKSARSEEKVVEEPEEDIEFSDESMSDESSDDDDGSGSEESSSSD